MVDVPEDIMTGEISRNGGGITGTSLPNRDSLYPTRTDPIATATRTVIGSRDPMYRTSQSRQIVISDPTATRTINARNPINRGTADRAIAYQTTTGNVSAVQLPPEGITPIDTPIEKMFRGFWNEPVRGSADKQGQFLYIPPASMQSNSSMTFLLLAGVAVVGFIAYRRFKGA